RHHRSWQVRLRSQRVIGLPQAGAGEELLAGAEIYRVVDPTEVAPRGRHATTKDCGGQDRRHLRRPAEKRVHDVGNVVSRGDQDREDAARRRSDEECNFARLRINARPEAAGESKAPLLQRTANAEVPEDCLDPAAGGAQRNAPELRGPEERHEPLYDPRMRTLMIAIVLIAATARAEEKILRYIPKHE